MNGIVLQGEVRNVHKSKSGKVEGKIRIATKKLRRPKSILNDYLPECLLDLLNPKRYEKKVQKVPFIAFGILGEWLHTRKGKQVIVSARRFGTDTLNVLATQAEDIK